ncbi:hypothetical protein QWZ13_05130 [Reinekea marina]|nr:hypothetical protein [Reinekea marina]MDN3648291.1 hypothetical protein [Reinekea marina]
MAQRTKIHSYLQMVTLLCHARLCVAAIATINSKKALKCHSFDINS